MSRRREDSKKQLLQELARTPIVQVACKKAGVARATYYRWLKEDVQFAEAAYTTLDQSVGLVNDMAESQLISAIKNGHMTAIIFWLKFHHPTYETRIKVDAKVKHEPEALTSQQAELVEKALRMANLLENQENNYEPDTAN